MIDESTPSSLFQSFFMGGFECATHRRRDGTRIDVTSATGHDANCRAEFALLAHTGIRTVRDGLRWHLIETAPGVYDWSTFLPMLHAAYATGTQVIWDLCHWGVPDDIDIFSDAFLLRFAHFAAAAAGVIRDENLRAGVARPQVYCAINEISFWAWIGGDVGAFYPYRQQHGPELKQQLVRASLAAIQAIREVDPSARFVQPEPLINIVPDPHKPEDRLPSERHTASQYETWDWLSAGTAEVPAGLDIVGINYYWNNQWVHQGERASLGHLQHRPLHYMLLEVWERYKRPLLLSETGAEGDAAVGWLGYISAEVRLAQLAGANILGVCLYPVMDYPGWDDDRHCPCGLIELDQDWKQRSIRKKLAVELRAQQTLFNLASENALRA